MERDVLAGEELPPFGVVLSEPALHRELLQSFNGLRVPPEDASVNAVQAQGFPETSLDPLRTVDLAVVAVPAGVLGHASLSLVEMVQEQRVLVGPERFQRGRLRFRLPPATKARTPKCTRISRNAWVMPFSYGPSQKICNVGQVANLPVGQVANLPKTRQIDNLPHVGMLHIYCDGR